MGLTQRPGQTASTLATVGTRWVHPQHSVLRTPKWFRTVMPQTACALPPSGSAAIRSCRSHGLAHGRPTLVGVSTESPGRKALTGWSGESVAS